MTLTADQAKVLAQFSALSISEQEHLAPLLQVAKGQSAASASGAHIDEPRRAANAAYTPVLVNDGSFWSTEASSALMSRNDCVNSKTFGTYQRRVRSWLHILKIEDTPVDASRLSVDASAERIFTRDAERTVESPARRIEYIKALSLVYQKVGDYHQGQGYICAFMSMFLTTEDLARVLWFLHESTQHHSGYYKAEPQSFVADAMVMYELAKVYVPHVVTHLENMGFIKDNAHMYCVKWFTGLGLHMMPFSILFSFMELFLLHGRDFLFRFSIVYLANLESEIVKRTSINAVNSLLRNENVDDHKKPHPVIAAWPEVDFFHHVIEKALQFDLNSALDYKSMCEKEHHLHTQLMAQRRARVAEMAAEASDDEIVFSDEEDG
eukprot:GEMP01019083.1.p1 GENE.GEMP01019083.1~~GEMP01019083.1.p1  ORF type:complete len:380 (+),score=105.22 GEMP01019083.1:171-1310(+)